MGFKLRIIFSGICTLVPDKPWDEARKALVLFPRCDTPPDLPDRKRNVSSTDGKSLMATPSEVNSGVIQNEAHDTHLKFDMKHLLACGNHPHRINGIDSINSKVLWQFNRKNIWIKNGSYGEQEALSVRNSREEGLYPLSNLASFDKVLPGAKLSDQCFSENDVHESLGGRFFVSNGLLSTVGDLHEWTFGPIDSKVYSGPFANQILLEIDCQSCVTIAMSDFGSDDTDEIVLASVNGEDVTLEIANLPKMILMPLGRVVRCCQMGIIDYGGPEPMIVDWDFRYYYQLLDEKTSSKLKKELEEDPSRIAPCPIFKAPDGGDPNCTACICNEGPPDSGVYKLWKHFFKG